MNGDYFQIVRERVPTSDAARVYGYEPNRAGFINCPFHAGDRNASLKLYDNGGWYCFGCCKGGSVIDFTAELFGLDPMGAVRRLNQDFHLALHLDRPPTAEEQAAARIRRRTNDTYRAFTDWREQTMNRLNESFRIAHIAKQDKSPDEWTDAEVLAVRWQATIEYWSDTLDYGSMEEQMAIFKDREEVMKLCNQILQNTKKKSGAA